MLDLPVLTEEKDVATETRHSKIFSRLLIVFLAGVLALYANSQGVTLGRVQTEFVAAKAILFPEDNIFKDKDGNPIVRYGDNYHITCGPGTGYVLDTLLPEGAVISPVVLKMCKNTRTPLPQT
jgi:hypothetical protein